MPLSDSQPQVRLAELVAALSLGVDLGFGQPMEHVLRHASSGFESQSASTSTSRNVPSCTTRRCL
jgi:hypothetical protein